MLFLADILPTGFEIGVQYGGVKPAAIAGASRIVAVDLEASRLAHAEELGATHTVVSGEDAEQQVLGLTEGRGVDVAIEAVGVPDTFDLCTRIVRAGGRVANIGVHGRPTTLHLEDLWIKNITITTGLVSGATIPTLLQLVRGGRIAAEKLGTHTFALGEIMDAYDVFAAAGENDALKVVLKTLTRQGSGGAPPTPASAAPDHDSA